MNIFLISYGDFDYDGRLRELYKVFGELGELYSITRGSAQQDPHHQIYKGGYAGFIGEAVRYGRKMEKIDVLVLDNRKSVIPGLILRQIVRPRITIQDCRELYVRSEVSHFAGKVGCVIEKWGIGCSDILICANQDRAGVMKEMFGLQQEPIVYENLRMLEYSSQDAKNAAAEKFAGYIHEDELRILSSSGCSVSRTNDILVQNLDKVNGNCRLFLVGSNSEEDKNAIELIMKQKGLSNVEILGQLNQDELKYLLSVSHIGIVNYHQKDTNNKYCASGKVYEFLYEGLPVVTTTNPPLKRMCDGAKIGAADDAYFGAINHVAANYDEYQKNVRAYAVQHPVSENNKRLLESLKERMAVLY